MTLHFAVSPSALMLRNPSAIGSGVPAAGGSALITSLVVFLSAVVLVGLAIGLWNRRKLQAAAKQLEAQGFHVNIKVQKRPDLPFPEFTKHRGKINFQIVRPGTSDTAIRYRYTTGSGDQQKTVVLSCALIPVPFRAPEVSISQGRPGLAARITRTRVETDSQRFNERFAVTSDDERFAYTMLSYEVVDWLMNDQPLVKDATVRLADGWLLIARPQIGLLELPQLLSLAVSLRDTFPRVLTSLYPPSVPPT